jgi:DNA modification methylase
MQSLILLYIFYSYTHYWFYFIFHIWSMICYTIIYFLKLISHTLCPCTSWKKPTKEYKKGIQKGDTDKFFGHLKEFGPKYVSIFYNFKSSLPHINGV